VHSGLSPFALAYAENGREVHSVLERDDFGNVTRLFSQLDPYESRLVETSYKHLEDPAFLDNWLIDQPTRTTDTYFSTRGALPQTKIRVVDREYYDNGQLFATTSDPLDDLQRHRVELGRGAFGFVTSIREQGSGESRVTTFQLDDRQLYPGSVTNPLQQTSQLQWDRRTGTIQAVQDANLLVMQTWNDGFGRPVVQLMPNGLTTRQSYSYLDAFRPISVDVQTNAGTHVRHDFDLRNRLYEEHAWAAQSKELRQVFGYDRDGNLQTVSRPTDVTQPVGGVTTYSYDARGIRRETLLQNGGVVQTCYDLQTVCTTDPRGFSNCQIRDDRGRIVSMVEPVQLPCGQALGLAALGAGTTYEYGPFDAPMSITAPRGLTTVLTSDNWSRPISIRDPDTGYTSRGYNAFGERTSMIDANNQIMTFTYDALGRLTRRVDQGGNARTGGEVNEWIWDGGATLEPGEGELIGRMTETNSGDGVHRRYRYEATTGNLVGLHDDIDGDGFETTFTRDAVGRIRLIHYPQAAGLPEVTIQNVYGNSGALELVRDASAPSEGAPIWGLLDTDAYGAIQSEGFGSGFIQVHGYDPLGRQTTTSVTSNGQTSAALSLQVDYDPNGNIRTQTDLLRNLTAIYDYDAHDRLSFDSSAPDGTLLGYDDIGNLQRGAAFQYTNAQHPHAITYDGANGYFYDAVGNRTAKGNEGGGDGYTYTPQQKARSIFTVAGLVRSNQSDFRYDADGDRIVKDSARAKSVYVHGLYERRTSKQGEGTGAVEHVYSIVNGDRVVAQRVLATGQSPRTLYLHDDHRGSTRLVTNSSGAVEQEQSYDTFGNPRNAVTGTATPTPPDPVTSVAFTGQEADVEHSLVNMQGRIYDPQVGQFITPDPIVQRPLSSTGIHRYAYVFYNPLRYIDPTGFEAGCSGSDVCADDDDRASVSRTNTSAGSNEPPDVAMDPLAVDEGEGPSNPLGPLAPFSEMSERFDPSAMASSSHTDSRVPAAMMGPMQGGSYATGNLTLNQFFSQDVFKRQTEQAEFWRTYYEVSTSLVDLAASVPMALGNGTRRLLASKGQLLFHGTTAEHIAGIIESGGFIPKNGRVFFSEALGDTFKFGADISRRASFSIEVAVDTANTVRTSTPGVIRTVIVQSERLVPAEVQRLFIRTRNEAGEFTTHVVEGIDAIRTYLGL
jgi:RHS repeat-associated protein